MKALLQTPGLDERLTYALIREWAEPCVRPSVAGQLSEASVPMTVGLRQGGSDSSMAFIIAIDRALGPAVRKWTHLGYGFHIPGMSSLHHFLFIDDLILSAASVDQACEMFDDVQQCLTRAGLQVQAAKTQYWCNQQISLCQRHKLPGQDQSDVGLVVLGAVCHFPHGQAAALSHRIRCMWTVWQRLRGLLRCQTVPLQKRLQVLTMTVLQSLLWGLGSLPLRARDLSRLRAAHLAVLLRMIPYRRRKMTEAGLEEWTPWWVAKCRHVYKLAAELSHDLADKCWATRYWTWAGHLTRDTSQFPSSLVLWRSITWWRHQQQLVCGWRHKQKRGNLWRWEAPLQNWMDQYHKGAATELSWMWFAGDREQWRQLLPQFL